MLVTLDEIVKAPVLPQGKKINSAFDLLYTTPSTEQYLALLLSTEMDINPKQPSNTLPPTLVTLDGIITLVNPLQPANAYSRMLVTGQPPNADGIEIAPVIRLATAGEDHDPLPIDAWPLSTVYVHSMPSTIAVAATAEPDTQKAMIAADNHFITQFFMMPPPAFQ